MYVSLCNEVVAELPFAQQCELAAKLGYDGIELAPFTLGEEPHVLPAAERSKLRRTAESAGVPIRSLHYLMRAPQGLSITTLDDAQRRHTVAVMRALCELAADIGARVLVHGSPDQRRLDPADEAESRKRGVQSFADVAAAAAGSGVTYCIEPLSRDQTAFVNTVAEAVEIVRDIGNPAVATMIDCSSAARTEKLSVPDLLRQWLPTGHVAHVHFNDPNRRGPGDGELDFAPILETLRACQYGGNAAIEPFIYEPDGPSCAARAINYIRGLGGK
ncbi:MAG: sugar phosphate isomerase/epimerase family protein [Pseudolabrys sp.]